MTQYEITHQCGSKNVDMTFSKDMLKISIYCNECDRTDEYFWAVPKNVQNNR